jgi:hypothetical protein
VIARTQSDVLSLNPTRRPSRSQTWGHAGLTHRAGLGAGAKRRGRGRDGAHGGLALVALRAHGVAARAQHEDTGPAELAVEQLPCRARPVRRQQRGRVPIDVGWQP